MRLILKPFIIFINYIINNLKIKNININMQKTPLISFNSEYILYVKKIDNFYNFYIYDIFLNLIYKLENKFLSNKQLYWIWDKKNNLWIHDNNENKTYKLINRSNNFIFKEIYK